MDKTIEDLFQKAHAAKFLFMNKIIHQKELDFWYEPYEQEQHKKADEIAIKYGKKPNGGINRVAFMRGACHFTGDIIKAIQLLYPNVNYDTERTMIAAVRVVMNNRNREISQEVKDLIENMKRKEIEKKEKAKSDEKNKPLSLF